MKKVEWKKNFPDHFHAAIQEMQFEPGATGFAVYKGVTVHLKITEKENDLTCHAMVVSFDPATPALPDLKLGEVVEVGIQHFVPM